MGLILKKPSLVSPVKPTYDDADEISYLAKKLFTSGVVDEVILIYTQFKSALSFTPVSKKLLPVVPPQTGEAVDNMKPFDDDEKEACS